MFQINKIQTSVKKNLLKSKTCGFYDFKAPHTEESSPSCVSCNSAGGSHGINGKKRPRGEQPSGERLSVPTKLRLVVLEGETKRSERRENKAFVIDTQKTRRLRTRVLK